MRSSPALFLPLLLLLTVSLIVLTTPLGGQEADLFQKTWGGISYDDGNSVAVDSSGAVYVTGYTRSFGVGNGDLLVLKFDSSGDTLWGRTWGGSSDDHGYGIVVDSTGAAYVTGYTGSFGAGGDAVFLLKFDSTGDSLWQRTLGGGRGDYGFGVALDSSGDIYVAGQTSSFGAGSYDVLLLKFDSSGGLIWQRTWGGSSYDNSYGVAVDSSGAVYVTGYTRSFGAGSDDALLLKFNSSGGLIWQRTWGGSNTDRGYSVAVDSSGGAYVAGHTSSSGAGEKDVLLLKFDSTGNLLWQHTWGGSSDDHGYGVAVDSTGHIYVTGYTGSFGAGDADVFLLMLDSSGGLEWQHTWGGSDSDSGYGIVLDFSGTVLVVGRVSEAPPYTLGSPNFTANTPTSMSRSPSFKAMSTSISPASPSGVILTVLGSETYAGGGDALLFKYGMPFPPTTSTTTARTTTTTTTLTTSTTTTITGPTPSPIPVQALPVATVGLVMAAALVAVMRRSRREGNKIIP